VIDLHCHLLPGVDDGAADIAESLAMARIAVADGIRIVACTPHISPGVYDNNGPGIRDAVEELAAALFDNGIDLYLLAGADVHLAPNMVEGLKNGRILTLAESRYFLFEPPHHIVPPRLEEVAAELLAAGYVPILTHPERLSWIDAHYASIRRLFAAGVWMQITANSMTGAFGKAPRYWADRMLDEGIVHIIATDAHSTGRRRPVLSAARAAAAARLGEAEADRLCETRPLGIIKNWAPDDIVSPPALAEAKAFSSG